MEMLPKSENEARGTVVNFPTSRIDFSLLPFSDKCRIYGFQDSMTFTLLLLLLLLEINDCLCKSKGARAFVYTSTESKLDARARRYK